MSLDLTQPGVLFLGRGKNLGMRLFLIILGPTQQSCKPMYIRLSIGIVCFILMVYYTEIKVFSIYLLHNGRQCGQSSDTEGFKGSRTKSFILRIKTSEGKKGALTPARIPFLPEFCSC